MLGKDAIAGWSPLAVNKRYIVTPLWGPIAVLVEPVKIVAPRT